MATSLGTSEAVPETLLILKALGEAVWRLRLWGPHLQNNPQSILKTPGKEPGLLRGGSHLVPHSMELQAGQAFSLPSPSDTGGQGSLVGNANTLGSMTQKDTVDENSNRCSLHANTENLQPGQCHCLSIWFAW